MTVGRTLAVLIAATGLVVGPAVRTGAAARGEAVEKKTITGPKGRTASVMRFADRRDGRTVHSVTMTAEDVDGRDGRCTETWVDYRTKPHQHLNPGLVVNCSGGRRSVTGAVATDYHGVAGMSVIVCDVPETSGRIRRDGSNCRGGLGAMSLHSNRRYDEFGVDIDADRSPGGVRIWHV
ncbi:MAG TPA: hypothetical protein VEG38_16215 [Acidimicrobiia bacterium]|nr:hypothetical protein [Acidimicrobiia bacterium]